MIAVITSLEYLQRSPEHKKQKYYDNILLHNVSVNITVKIKARSLLKLPKLNFRTPNLHYPAILDVEEATRDVQESMAFAYQ
eukprot:3264051-Amphidinium_carterae.1